MVGRGFFAGRGLGSVTAPRLIDGVGHIRTVAGLASLASAAALMHLAFIDPDVWIAVRICTGFAFAGLIIVTESWLNASVSSAQRGRLLAIYGMVGMAAGAAGQFLLNLGDPAEFILFVLVSIVMSLALVPISLTRIEGPRAEEGQEPPSLKRLWGLSPYGAVTAALVGASIGTFYGLATTVPAVVDTIKSLALGSGESSSDVVSRLRDGLGSQCGGMGVAFASSLLGLAGSLVVGLLELFASHGQNRFYRELEEWLSSITRVGFSTGEGEGGDISVLGAAFEHMSGQLEQLRQTMVAGGTAQGSGDTAALSEAMHRMADRLDAQDTATQALLRIAEGQERLIAQLSDGGGLDGGMDAESRMRLRSIDVQMLRILEEISAGRQESMTELRTELNGIARALRRIGKAAEGESSGPVTKVQLKRPPAPKGGKEG